MVSTASVIALSDVVDVFTAEMDEIESIFVACKGARTVQGFRLPYVPFEDGCLVSMWDAWTRFLRSLVIAGAAGDSMGLSGTLHLQPNPRTEAEVLAYLQANRRGHNFKMIGEEPKWNDVTCLSDIATTLTLANQQAIVGAIGSTVITLGPIAVTNPLEEVRLCRNFVAHKSEQTLRDAAAYSRGQFVDLSTHLRALRSGIETFREWKDCMLAIANAAAQ